jgi:hypothetical protein
MDPHFPEYLAAIAGMRDVYGDRPDEHPTEFHEDRAGVDAAAPAVAAT